MFLLQKKLQQLWFGYVPKHALSSTSTLTSASCNGCLRELKYADVDNLIYTKIMSVSSRKKLEKAIPKLGKAKADTLLSIQYNVGTNGPPLVQ
jgi:hypothetical protein